ncbi:hypothetical protein ebA6532 [Aromatoleum aromaticum EbN1]|uniref:Uncharacterized protein n=1 Tax=Aromatoleum aromaticum (strain DSM 19018 / LMG 30748 / EbN1) TaxID=76114 RepID=Q5NYK5_AROAE|nr:hypothetical protein ebA6532 [Aromatoleum aromaticum EbN1]
MANSFCRERQPTTPGLPMTPAPEELYSPGFIYLASGCFCNSRVGMLHRHTGRSLGRGRR